MQNHSTYDSGYFVETNELLSILFWEGRYEDVEEYLTLIQLSDRALPFLINYFSKVDEPTVLLFFGDHQPNLSESFYQEFCDPNVYDPSTLDFSQKYYQVPFFLWANYDIEEQTDCFTSLNFLGSFMFDCANIPCDAYQSFQLNLMKDIPAMNQFGYMDKNGRWYSNKAKSTFTSQLEDYWLLQYNHIKEEYIP